MTAAPNHSSAGTSELRQHDAHVIAFRWHQQMWMEREYRHAGERLS